MTIVLGIQEKGYVIMSTDLKFAIANRRGDKLEYTHETFEEKFRQSKIGIHWIASGCNAVFSTIAKIRKTEWSEFEEKGIDALGNLRSSEQVNIMTYHPKKGLYFCSTFAPQFRAFTKIPEGGYVCFAELDQKKVIDEMMKTASKYQKDQLIELVHDTMRQAINNSNGLLKGTATYVCDPEVRRTNFDYE